MWLNLIQNLDDFIKVKFVKLSTIRDFCEEGRNYALDDVEHKLTRTQAQMTTFKLTIQLSVSDGATKYNYGQKLLTRLTLMGKFAISKLI